MVRNVNNIDSQKSTISNSSFLIPHSKSIPNSSFLIPNSSSYHIKTLIIINIIITTAILLSRSLLTSFFITLSCVVAIPVFYDTHLLKQFFQGLYRFRVLFLTLFVCQLLLRRGGEVFLQFGVLQISSEGVYYSVNSILRYIVLISSATTLGSASPYQMIKALRDWRMPEVVVIVVSFTIQFLRQLQVEFRVLTRNLKRRGISFRGRGVMGRLRLTAQLVMPILGKLFEDIRYKVIAMELNGYGGGRRVVPFVYERCKLGDYLLVVVYVCLMVVLFNW